jgi:hypothetical protein
MKRRQKPLPSDPGRVVTLLLVEPYSAKPSPSLGTLQVSLLKPVFSRAVAPHSMNTLAGWLQATARCRDLGLLLS